MPICLCCGEDVDLEQDYPPVLPFCSHCVSERCRKCRTWVRVRKFERDPTFNLIGRPRGPRMKCGWGCGAKLTGRNMRAHFTICPKRPAGSPNGDCRTTSSKVKPGRPPGPRMKDSGPEFDEALRDFIVGRRIIDVAEVEHQVVDIAAAVDGLLAHRGAVSPRAEV